METDEPEARELDKAQPSQREAAEASTAFLMAPTSVGLKDHLYAAPSILANDTSTNQGGFEPSSNAVPWGKNLKKADGSLDTAGTTDYKHWAAGVYKLVMGARFKSEAYVEIEKA